MKTPHHEDSPPTSEAAGTDLRQDLEPIEPAGNDLVEISSLLDDHDLPPEVVASIDRIAGDEEARSYYLRARALDGLLDAMESPPREEPPAAVWSRIARQVEIDEGPMGWGREPLRLPLPPHRFRPALVAAALMMLTVVGMLWWQSRSPETDDGETRLAQIDIGARSGEMTPNRFFDLATEILEADRTYRRELLGLMVSIEQEMAGEETSREPSASSDFDDRRGDRGESPGDFGEIENRRRDGLTINLN